MVDVRTLSLVIGFLVGGIMIGIVCLSYVRHGRTDRMGLIIALIGAFLLAAPIWQDLELRLPGKVSLVAKRAPDPETVQTLFTSRVSFATYKVAVVNRSRVISDQQVKKAMPALQKQIHEHFSRYWSVDADLTFTGLNEAPPVDDWWLVILDETDMAGSLGYTELQEFRPLAKVFAKDALRYNVSWTVVASQQLMNLLVDPRMNLVVFDQSSVTDKLLGTLYAYRVVDPCEGDEYAYEIDGTKVSDFIFRAWFGSSTTTSNAKFDFQSKISAPFQVLPGGYATIMPVAAASPANYGWHQKVFEPPKDRISR